MHKSAFFEPYRSIGYVTDSTPFDLKHLGTENFITVSIGKSWQTLNCDKLITNMVGPIRDHAIVSIASLRDVTFTTYDREIIIWKRTHEVTRLSPPTGGRLVKLMLIGEVLLSLSEDLHLYTWDCSDLRKLFAAQELEDSMAKAEVTANYYTGEEESTNKREGVPTAYASNEGIYSKVSEKIEPVTHIAFERPIDEPTAMITSICHPQSYMNKVVIGWSTGAVELWNIRTSKRVHKFENLYKLGDPALAAQSAKHSVDDEYGQKKTKQRKIGVLSSSAITCIEKSPILDVVAIGTNSGNIILYNLKFDEPIHIFYQEGSVTSLAFRTDNQPFLVSSNTIGHLTLWDLTQKRMNSIIRYAHNGKITKIGFLPGLPILITTGTDNAIYQWIYDQADHSGRHLRSRSGHSLPPTCITFYDEQIVLSGGQDKALRLFSINRDQHNTEFSQGQALHNAKKQGRMAMEFKNNKITQIAVNRFKERDWDNILTAHMNDASGITWNYDRKVIGKHKLVNENALQKNADGTSAVGERGRGLGIVDASPVTSVNISYCGNFGFVGCSDGRIERYNMQSGLYRGRYGKKTAAAISLKEQERLNREEALQAVKNRSASKFNFSEAQLVAVDGKTAATMYGEFHNNEVTGVYSNSSNTRVVSTSLDHTVRFWDFDTFESIGVLCLGYGVSKSCYNEDSSLLAASTDDLRVHIVDVDSKRVVRRFKLSHRLTSMAFSGDGRLLVAAQSNGDVRVFDVPSGRLVDWFTFEKPVVNLAFSPKNDFLATVHTGSLGVFLWVNRSYFSHQFFGLTIPTKPTLMDLSLSNVYASNDRDMTSAVDSEQKDKRKRMQDEISEDEDDDDDDDIKAEREAFEPVAFAMKNPVSTDQVKSSVFGDLITLNGLPTSKWVQLPMLEQIRERNKAKEGLKAPTNAPFFLGVQTGVVSSLDPAEFKKKLQQEQQEAEKKALSRILVGNVSEDNALVNLCMSIPSTKKTLAMVKLGNDTQARQDLRFAQIMNGVDDDSIIEEEMKIMNQLSHHDHDEDLDEHAIVGELLDSDEADREADARQITEVTKFLLSLSPADLDAELRSLSVGDGEEQDVNNLLAFLHYLTLAAQLKQDYEFLQAVLNVFLKIHSQLVASTPHLNDLAQELLDEQRVQWRTLEQYMQSSLAMINHFCNIFS